MIEKNHMIFDKQKQFFKICQISVKWQI